MIIQEQPGRNVKRDENVDRIVFVRGQNKKDGEDVQYPRHCVQEVHAGRCVWNHRIMRMSSKKHTILKKAMPIQVTARNQSGLHTVNGSFYLKIAHSLDNPTRLVEETKYALSAYAM